MLPSCRPNLKLWYHLEPECGGVGTKRNQFVKIDHAPCQFQSIMLGNHSGDSMGAFWGHVKSLEAYKTHTLLHSLSPSELKQAVPCCIHGDGAEMFRDDEFWIMNWSALGSGGGYDCWVTRYPIIIVPERQMKDDAVFWLDCFNFRALWPPLHVRMIWAKHLFNKKSAQRGKGS